MLNVQQQNHSFFKMSHRGTSRALAFTSLRQRARQRAVDTVAANARRNDLVPHRLVREQAQLVTTLQHHRLAPALLLLIVPTCINPTPRHLNLSEPHRNPAVEGVACALTPPPPSSRPRACPTRRCRTQYRRFCTGTRSARARGTPAAQIVHTVSKEHELPDKLFSCETSEGGLTRYSIHEWDDVGGQFPNTEQ